MSFLTAVAIAEKRIGRKGEGVYSGRSRVVLERSWIQFKSSAWLVVLSGFIEPLLNLVVFGFGVGQFIGDIKLENGLAVSYASYVVPGLLASAAMMGLGLAPRPDSGKTEVNLELARQNIDLLEMIQAKTKNNLTPDEANLLERVLYEVRTKFLEVSKK